MYNVLYSTSVQEDNNETIELNLSSFPQYQRESRLSNSSLPNYTLPLYGILVVRKNIEQ